MSRVRPTPEGKIFLQPSMVRYLAKMVGCYLWRGDPHELKRYARTLRDVLSQAPRTIELLSEADRARALYVIDCFDQGIDPSPWKACSNEMRGTMIVPIGRLPETWQERDVCQAVYDDPSLLAPLCDVDRIERLRFEASAGDGRIDIAFSVGRTEHVVEVKAQQADHRVVGQVQKYMRSVGSIVHYDLFDHVTGWVVAPDFTPDATVQLADIGVRMVKLSVR